MAKLGVAIIGAGIGAEHFAAYAQLPDMFAVRWICDLDLVRAEGVRQGETRITDSIDEALADPMVDIIDVCLPPHLHLTAIEKALRAGKAVICEKPLVGSLDEVDRVEALVAETNGRIFPVFQYRFGKGATQLKALQDAGLAGKPFVASLETHWRRDADYYDNDWRGTWAGEQGGAILGHAIHIHDWLSFVLGPVARVYAELGTRVNDIEVEDCAALSIRMTSGALVTSSITLGAGDDTSRLRFVFEGFSAESGRAPYTPAEEEWTFVARACNPQELEDALKCDVPYSGFAGLFHAIGCAIQGQDNQAVTPEDARRSIEFVTAVYASARTGQAVDLPLKPDHPLYGGWQPSVV